MKLIKEMIRYVSCHGTEARAEEEKQPGRRKNCSILKKNDDDWREIDSESQDECLELNMYFDDTCTWSQVERFMMIGSLHYR